MPDSEAVKPEAFSASQLRWSPAAWSAADGVIAANASVPLVTWKPGPLGAPIVMPEPATVRPRVVSVAPARSGGPPTR